MVKFTNIFSDLKKINVLVAGDFMLDKYTYGKVERISPEAPVCVLKVEDESYKAGGAGNVVLNLLSLGANVKALGRLGKDLMGEMFKEDLKSNGADTTYVFEQENYITPIKNRFIADSQQILRVDKEKNDPTSFEIEKEIENKIDYILEDIHVVAISDYLKGFLSDRLLKLIIDKANEKNIPTIVDPKGINFSKYNNASIIKPNLQEAYLAAKLSKNESLESVAKTIIKDTNAKNLIITRSQDGISLFTNGSHDHFKVVSKEVKDVTGAGDTVLATLSIAIGNKIDLKNSCIMSNVAASISIEHIGCYRVSLKDLMKRFLERSINNKIIDLDYFLVLKNILTENEFSILSIKSKNEITTSIYKAIKNIASERKLIVNINENDYEGEFIDFLSSLNEISFIILPGKNSNKILNEIGFSSFYSLEKNGSLIKTNSI